LTGKITNGLIPPFWPGFQGFFGVAFPAGKFLCRLIPVRSRANDITEKERRQFIVDFPTTLQYEVRTAVH